MLLLINCVTILSQFENVDFNSMHFTVDSNNYFRFFEK